MRMKFIMIVLIMVGMQSDSLGQQKTSDPYFYDTLTILDLTTNAASERISRLKNPINRNFYLKSGETTYHLFTNSEAILTADAVLELLDDGFSLYIDKLKHKQHLNLRPAVMEVLDENGEVIEVVENIGSMKASVLARKLKVDNILRFSGFPISVNEKKLGPIMMNVRIAE